MRRLFNFSVLVKVSVKYSRYNGTMVSFCSRDITERFHLWDQVKKNRSKEYIFKLFWHLHFINVYNFLDIIPYQKTLYLRDFKKSLFKNRTKINYKSQYHVNTLFLMRIKTKLKSSLTLQKSYRAFILNFNLTLKLYST